MTAVYLRAMALLECLAQRIEITGDSEMLKITGLRRKIRC
jgi:CII-binding regulator of phage lambda lysogenization HflD